MPGTVDQTPVLIELENHERRFVFVPESGSKESEANAQHRRKRNEHLKPLKTTAEEPDLLSQRQPSPYAFTKPTQPASTRPASTRPAPAQPAPAQPAPTWTAPPISSHHDRSKPTANTSRGNSGSSADASEDDSHRRARNSRTKDSGSDERHSDGSDLDSSAVNRLRERNPKPRVSFHEPSSSSSSRSRPNIKRMSSDITSPADSRSKTLSNGSGIIKSAMKKPISTQSSDDEMPKRMGERTMSPSLRTVPIPAVLPVLPQHIRAENGHGGKPSLDELRDSERARKSRSTYPPAIPPKTPIGSDGRGSRPTSPSLSNYDTRDFAHNIPRSNSYIDASKGYDSGYERQADGDRPFTSNSRNSSYESVGSPRNEIRPKPATVLPYPVDDPMLMMPDPGAYIDTPTRERFPPQPKHLHFDAGRMDSPSSSSDNFKQNERMPSQPRTEATAPLPPCPRMTYSRGYTDWFTLRGDPSVDICPTCYEGIIRPTQFRVEFALAPPRSPTVQTRCDFGSPWYRAAWLLTQKRQRQDLDLIYALSAIASVDAVCPGSIESAGPWYGLRHVDQKFIPGLSICSRDLKYIEAIFPSLLGLFHRMPTSMPGREARICSLRLPGEHFGDYLDLLEKIDEEARVMPLNAAPTLQHLIKFVRGTTVSLPTPPANPVQPPEKCTRDNLLIDTPWYYTPLLPDFTVCEDCFDTVIWPSIQKGSTLATDFHQVLTPLPAGIRTDGASCQLYSPRMRKIWKRAVEEGEREGMKLLARKVRERREVEDELREEQGGIQRKLERNRKGTGVMAEDIRASCKRKLDAIAREWADWE